MLEGDFIKFTMTRMCLGIITIILCNTVEFKCVYGGVYMYCAYTISFFFTILTDQSLCILLDDILNDPNLLRYEHLDLMELVEGWFVLDFYHVYKKTST